MISKNKFTTGLLVALASLFNLSCSNPIENIINKDTKVIKIDPDEKIARIKFEDYFSAWKLVPLETSPNSLIGNIGRISVYKSMYYILDVLTNSVLMFDSTGKFINKIQSRGNSEGKYIGLKDFAVDEKENRLILYSHNPYKLLYFDLNCKFINEQRLSTLYDNIATSDSSILLVNPLVNDGFMISAINKETQAERKIMPLLMNSKYFSTLKIRTPSIVKSKTMNISFFYSDTIYTWEKGNIMASYFVDFGQKKLPEQLITKQMTVKDIYANAIKNEYGFALSNFRDFNDWIYFSYGSSIGVLYNKKDKSTTRFNFVKNTENYLEFGNVFSHDGNDNDLISIYPASRFKQRISQIKASNLYEKIPETIKAIQIKTKDTDNPLLLVYTLKKK